MENNPEELVLDPVVHAWIDRYWAGEISYEEAIEGYMGQLGTASE